MTANRYGLPSTTSVVQHGRFKGHSFYYKRILQEAMGHGGLGLIKSGGVILNRTTFLNTDLVIGSEKVPLNNDRLRFRLAILNRFSAILLCCDSAHFFASRCGNSGDSKPAIPGIVRFAIRDSVPLSSGVSCYAFSRRMLRLRAHCVACMWRVAHAHACFVSLLFSSFVSRSVRPSCRFLSGRLPVFSLFLRPPLTVLLSVVFVVLVSCLSKVCILGAL